MIKDTLHNLASRVGLWGAAAVMAPLAMAAPGDLDTSFNTTGRVSTSVSSYESANAVAIQPDGKIVVCGYAQGSGQDFAVVRYNADGSLDTTFDADGIQTTDFVASSSDSAYAVAIDSSGRIVVAGYTDGGSAKDFAVARYLPSGSLDTAFGTGGKVVTDLGGDGDEARAIVLLPDGKLIVAGTAADSGGGYSNFAVVRYNTDGSLDTTFDTDGIATTNLSASDFLLGAAAQLDGKLVACGYAVGGTGRDFGIVRYNTDGSPDTTFDTDGILMIDVGGAAPDFDQATGVAIQPDGKIVVGGSSNGDLAIIRCNADGSADTTFDTDGLALADSGGSDSASSLALQPDGKIVVCRGASNPFGVARLNNDGSMDGTFGTAGFASTTFGAAVTEEPHAMALQPDGAIVVVGILVESISDYNFGVARFEGDTPDITPDAFVFTDVTGVTASTLQTSNSITVAGLGAGVSAAIQVSGGEYRINSTAFTSLPGWVANGDIIEVRHTSSSTAGGLVATTLTIGGVLSPNSAAVVLGSTASDTFTSTVATSGGGSTGGGGSGGDGGGGCTAEHAALPFGMFLLILATLLPVYRNRRRKLIR